MPETTTRSFGWMRSFESAWYIELSTPKSPHPGHQIGCSSVLYSCGVSSGSVVVDMRGNLLNFVENFLGRKRQPDGFIQLHEVEGEAFAQQCGELAGVVELGDDHGLGAVDQLAKARERQRVQDFRMERAD